MIDLLTKLFVFKNSEDISEGLSDFQADTQAVTLLSTDKMYIGFTKPIYSIYLYAKTPSTTPNTLAVKYWNNQQNSFQNVDVLSDGTKGFTANGFIQWGINQNALNNEFSDHLLNGKSLFWLELSLAANTSAMELQAINILFCDDKDLQREFFPVLNADFRLGATDFTSIHESVRDDIVQKIRNKGINKWSRKDVDLSDRLKWQRITAFDFLDIQEIRVAACYFALSKIFYSVSDKPDDNWNIKAQHYNKLAEEMMNTVYISLDLFNDGSTAQRVNIDVMRLKR